MAPESPHTLLSSAKSNITSNVVAKVGFSKHHPTCTLPAFLGIVKISLACPIGSFPPCPHPRNKNNW